MVEYAAGKTDWAASITNDLFGKEPAIHYAAMYAAAFDPVDAPPSYGSAISEISVQCQ